MGFPSGSMVCARCRSTPEGERKCRARQNPSEHVRGRAFRLNPIAISRRLRHRVGKSYPFSASARVCNEMVAGASKDDKDLQKAAGMRKRSIALASAVFKRQLDDLLKQQPQLIVPTLNHAKALRAKMSDSESGFIVDGTSLSSVKGEEEEVHDERAAASGASFASLAKVNPAIVEPKVSPNQKRDHDEMVDRGIDRQTTRLQQLPLGDLKIVCIFLQPIAFSLFNLRGIAVRGNRTMAQEKHCELIEFEIGVPGSALLERRFTTVGSLAQYLQSFQAKMGQRGSTLRLPPDWQRDGVYMLRNDNGAAYIKNRFTGKECELPEKYSVDPAHLCVQQLFRGAGRDPSRGRVVRGEHREVNVVYLRSRRCEEACACGEAQPTEPHRARIETGGLRRSASCCGHGRAGDRRRRGPSRRRRRRRRGNHPQEGQGREGQGWRQCHGEARAEARL